MSIKYKLILGLIMLTCAAAWGQAESHHEDEHASESHHEDGHEEFNPTEEILHHIQDTHNWHITDIPTGGENYIPVEITLPWLFYSSRDGLVFAAGEEDLKEQGYIAHHEKVHALIPGTEVPESEGHGHHSSISEEWLEAHEAHEVSIFDISLTRTSFQMLIIGLLLLLVFGAVARGYKKREGEAPKGIQSFFEPIIVFVRDEIARSWIHKGADRFVPYLLTLFFFIWFSNLLGLTPFNSNIAGNLSVTAALALLTFIITQVNGTKDYWMHIFNTPGVPWYLKFGIPLVPIVEFLGIFTKPFALAIRLFANISAGHFMVLGLVFLIFILGNNGANPTGALAISPVTVLFTLVIFGLEMIVAIIQAYIFTLLTAVFVGMAREEHSDHH